MGLVAFLVILFVWGLIVGGLARLAVPGPDPMSVWWTAALGLAGSFVGGIIGRVLFGSGGGFLLAFAGAVLLLIAYRHFVEKRPIWGPGARRRPPAL
jgi:uncharacterized membrane protein YeaQ/YmgE (transglycosylase-associated protein family)